MELTIPASPAHLAGLRRAARDALCEVPPEVADEMLLALDEAATNAILYGSRGGDPVEVAVRVRGAWVEATVLDQGLARPPHPPATTGWLGGRGWGLWLLRCLVDEVRLERVESGTRVTLRRRLRSPGARSGDDRQPSAAHAVPDTRVGGPGQAGPDGPAADAGHPAALARGPQRSRQADRDVRGGGPQRRPPP